MANILDTWLAADSSKKVLLLRHGAIQTPSDEKRMIGQIDLPLNDVGRRQAQYWQTSLANVPLMQIVSSDLSRCMETARIIASGRSIPIVSQTGLREINLGQWDGMTVDQVKQRWPDAYRQRGTAMATFRPPAGESFLDLHARVVPIFETAVRHASKSILIVAHAGVNRIILCHLLGMPLENLFRLVQGWGAMNLINRLIDGYRIEALNLLPEESLTGSASRV